MGKWGIREVNTEAFVEALLVPSGEPKPSDHALHLVNSSEYAGLLGLGVRGDPSS